MKFEQTRLEGAFVVEPQPKADERGFFARAWCEEEFRRHGMGRAFVQANTSYSRRRGTLRGMHYQAAPHAEGKLVRCTRGGIYDVMVDLRPDSRTYLQWIAVEITAANRRMVYVPEGFAHGFQTLEDDTEVFYQVTHRYEPAAERGVRWDDPAVGIVWPDVDERLMSERDRQWPLLAVEKEKGGQTPLRSRNGV